MRAYGGGTDGYLGNDQVGLNDVQRPAIPVVGQGSDAGAAFRQSGQEQTATSSSRPRASRSGGMIQGTVSNVRKDARPYGNVSWQILTFELERRDRSGSPVAARVAVEMRGLSFSGPIPADGAVVRIFGRYSRDGVFRADRVVNANTGHVLTARMGKSVKAVQWIIMGFVLVVFTVVITSFATDGAVFKQIMPTGGDTTTHTRTVTVPNLTGMNQSEADAALERAGVTTLEYRIVLKNSSSVRFGQVINTEPPAGASVTLDGQTTKVYVNISIGSR